jgi:hypothetical protein
MEFIPLKKIIDDIAMKGISRFSIFESPNRITDSQD